MGLSETDELKYMSNFISLAFCFFPRYTQNNSTNPAVVYATLLSWPRENNLVLGAPSASANTVVTLVGYSGSPFNWTENPSGGITVVVPDINLNDMPSQWAWVLKLTNLVF